MPTHHFQCDHIDPEWDDTHIKAALSCADHLAARWGRRGRRCRADVDDLRQDILLAVLERVGAYDANQGAWSTFVALLGHHVVLDRIRADRSAGAVAVVSLDIEALDASMALRSATQPEAGDCVSEIARRIDLESLVADLPTDPRETLALLMASQGDIAEAQRSSGRSLSVFYRSVADLRMWLRAGGLGVPPTPLGKSHGSKRK